MRSTVFKGALVVLLLLSLASFISAATAPSSDPEEWKRAAAEKTEQVADIVKVISPSGMGCPHQRCAAHPAGYRRAFQPSEMLQKGIVV